MYAPQDYRPLGQPPQAGPTNGSPFNLQTVIIALRCWWHIALPLALLLGAGAASAVYYTTEPTFSAQAWLRIQMSPFRVVGDRGAAFDSERFVQNQIEFLKSPPVLDPVVANSLIATTPELIDEPDRALYLRNHLWIKAQGNSEYYVIEFASADRFKAAAVVNEVAAQFIELQRGHERQLFSRMMLILQDLETKERAEVDLLWEDVRQKSLQLFGKDPFVPEANRAQVNSDRDPAMELRSKLADAQVEMQVLDARRKAEKEFFESESFEPDPALVAVAVESIPEVVQLRERIDTIQSELEAMERRAAAGKASTHPDYRRLRDDLAAAEATLEKTLPELKTAETERMKFEAKKRRENEIERLDMEVKLAEGTIRFLDGQLVDVRKERQAQGQDTLALEKARDEYERRKLFLNAITTRITDMQVQQQAPQRVELFQAASVPSRPDEAVPYKNMGMAGFLAFMLPFAAAVGIEVLYRRVSSRQQLESAGNIAVVAEVTTLPKRVVSHRKLKAAAPPRDTQLFEESIDGLRTYLTLVDTMQGRKVLAVTSAISREGKTSLAAQLAVSIASTTSRPTLLIDGDMRSPDIHRIFDVDCGPGLCEVLRGECPVEEAIETDFSDSLHLLTAGELRGSPHRILGDGKFTLLLDQLRGMYDYVVVDTPPILAASESLLMASSADAAILCVRRDFSRIDQVTTAFSRLKSAGVKTAGAVLNGVPVRQYAYHYGGYYYSRGNQPESEADASTVASA